MKHAEVNLEGLQVVELEGEKPSEEQLGQKAPRGNFMLRHQTCLTTCQRMKTRLKKGPTIAEDGKPVTNGLKFEFGG